MDDLSSDDDFIEKKSSSRGNLFWHFVHVIRKENSADITAMFCLLTLYFVVPKSSKTPAAQHPVRRPLSQCESPVFVSGSDDDDCVVIKSSWKTRHSKPQPLKNANKGHSPYGDQDGSSPVLPLPPIPSLYSLPTRKPPVSLTSARCSGPPKRTLSAPSKMEESASSDEEFTSLLERLKMKNKLTGGPFSPKNIRGKHFLLIVAFRKFLNCFTISLLWLCLI